MPFGDAPDVFSVEEAAAVLRIGRGKAYEQARLFLATDGAEGLPVVTFGRCFRVPRAGLEKLLGGEIHWSRPTEAEQPPVPDGDEMAGERAQRRGRPSARRDDRSLRLFTEPGE